jgi:hypothetical protein
MQQEDLFGKADNSTQLDDGANDQEVEAKRQADFDKLTAQLEYHERCYREGHPEISDAAFDDLFDRYQALADELDVPAEKRIDSKPGADHTDGFVSIAHKVPMLSLEKLSFNRRDSKGEPVSQKEQLVPGTPGAIKTWGSLEVRRSRYLSSPRSTASPRACFTKTESSRKRLRAATGRAVTSSPPSFWLPKPCPRS